MNFTHVSPYLSICISEQGNTLRTWNLKFRMHISCSFFFCFFVFRNLLSYYTRKWVVIIYSPCFFTFLPLLSPFPHWHIKIILIIVKTVNMNRVYFKKEVKGLQYWPRCSLCKNANMSFSSDTFDWGTIWTLSIDFPLLNLHFEHPLAFFLFPSLKLTAINFKRL